MKILLLGSGGREHAFAWKINQSSLCTQLFTAPGNAGTLQFGKNIDIEVNDFKKIKDFCLKEKIAMVVVGPEEPLVNGIYDYFKQDDQVKHIHFVGPSKAASQLEGSKSFAKSFMRRNNIPTGVFKEFTAENYDEGINYIKNHSLPIVLKADGLAAGKGVLICNNHIEAMGEYELMIQQSKFGEAGKKVVVEEFLKGIEVSVFVLTDGKNYLLLPEAKDYKRIGEGDTGLNTGGMGAISPVPFFTEHFKEKIITKIVEPTMAGIQKEDLKYCGFIFIGIIKVDDEPFVIEYNCRMGDPETEVVLPRIKNDLVKLFAACSHEKLHEQEIEIDKRCSSAIIAVSEGYPGDYEKGLPIDLGYLENPEAKKDMDIDGGVFVFHAGTKISNGEIVTNGGRVLAVSSLADTLGEAIEMSKDILNQIHFDGMYYRNDIGYEFID